MINNNLRKFVEDNHRVIIPNVGAFLRKNNANLTFEASITFSPFLRFNDGLLENLLAEKENISKEAASEAVNRFVQDLQASIAEKHLFYIKSLGAFYQDERNAVQFIYAETEREASRKVQEIMPKMEGYGTPLLDSLEKKETTFAQEAEEKPVKTMPEAPASAAAPEKLPPNAPENHAQQLEVASNSLQQWIEKRKKDVANISKDAKQPEEEDREFDATPSVESDAAQPLTEPAHNKQPQEQPQPQEKPQEPQPQPQPQPQQQPQKQLQPQQQQPQQQPQEQPQLQPQEQQPQQQPQEQPQPQEQEPQQQPQEQPQPQEQSQLQEDDSLPHAQTYQEAEAKRHRQEAIARALAEKVRKEQQAKLEEEEARKKREAAQQFGAGSAPLVPGAWEEDVMGKGKSRSFGAWIFLSVMAFAFVAGMFALLYRPSMLDFFDDREADMRERIPPSAAPVAAKNLQSPAPAPVQQPDVYYLVAGVFNFEDNARAVSQKLYAAKKLKSEVVQTHDGKFAVCLSRYSSKEAALQNIDKYRKQHISVWVVR